MKTMILGLAVMTVIGCGRGEVDPSKVVAAPAGAEEAEAIVFELYATAGMTRAPTLFWYGGAALDCPDGVSFHWDGDCVDGTTIDETAIVLSDCAAEGLPFHRMCYDYQDNASMAHEMAHALSLQTGGDGCGDHNCASFRPGGLVEQATNLLAAAGK